MNWYLMVLKKYVTFGGRARRKEYWMFSLFNIIFTIAAMTMDNLLGINFNPSKYGPIYCLYGIAVFLPSLAVSVRRLHDAGKSGWYLFMALIPIAGAILILVKLCTDGITGQNKYGPNPKEAITA
jgi:uncharacterized membrane protein YhaH (DUF805 family)